LDELLLGGGEVGQAGGVEDDGAVDFEIEGGLVGAEGCAVGADGKAGEEVDGVVEVDGEPDDEEDQGEEEGEGREDGNATSAHGEIVGGNEEMRMTKGRGEVKGKRKKAKGEHPTLNVQHRTSN